MSARILVTGATGFIRGQLADRLAARGYEVRCLVRNRGDGRTRALERDGFDLVNAAKRAGHPVLRFHDLRHSFGTQAIPAFNIYEVQRMMGHRHITTTERYLHYAPDPDAAAAKLSGL